MSQRKMTKSGKERKARTKFTDDFKLKIIDFMKDDYDFMFGESRYGKDKDTLAIWDKWDQVAQYAKQLGFSDANRVNMRHHVKEWSIVVKKQNHINHGQTGSGPKPHKLDRDWEKLLLQLAIGNR